MMPVSPLIEPITPAKINFIVRKTKYPAAHAPTIGKPTSAISLKMSCNMNPRSMDCFLIIICVFNYWNQ